MTKPYGHVHANNRRHGPYDARSFRRAMRDGLDPAGNVLEPAMPRYDLDDADLDALIAYLKRLDAQRDPGITDTTIRIGTVLPTSGRLADTGRAVQRVLQGYFDGINQKGGVHGRRLQLSVAGMGDEASNARTAVERLLKHEPVLALLAPLTARSEVDFTAAAEAAQVPVVGPLTLFPESASASSTVCLPPAARRVRTRRGAGGADASRAGPQRPTGRAAARSRRRRAAAPRKRSKRGCARAATPRCSSSPRGTRRASPRA